MIPERFIAFRSKTRTSIGLLVFILGTVGCGTSAYESRMTATAKRLRTAVPKAPGDDADAASDLPKPTAGDATTTSPNAAAGETAGDSPDPGRDGQTPPPNTAAPDNKGTSAVLPHAPGVDSGAQDSVPKPDHQALIAAANPADWRTNYYSFYKNFSVHDVPDGTKRVDWGEMALFKELYETQKEFGFKRTHIRSAENKAQAMVDLKNLSERHKELEAELGQIVWELPLMYACSQGGGVGNIDIRVPRLPPPAEIIFFVDREHSANWPQLPAGAVVRAACKLGGLTLDQEFPNLTFQLRYLGTVEN